MADILIIDDDKLICTTLSNVVRDMGHAPTCAFTRREGLEIAISRPFDVVFLDVRLPDGSGLDMVRSIRETLSSPEVIIITGFSDIHGAELAITYGAWDYLDKSASINDITLQLGRALQYRRERQSKARPTALKLEGIIGSSPSMMTCIELLAQAAKSDANVLVTGETGTGKELFSWAIHHNSTRAGKNFVVVDCASLPETIVESVLFGHEKGAFTGADKSKAGLITQAHGGTLFLDEVGELPSPIQASFLRVLQEKRLRPVGSIKEVESDFRLIAASNRNLDEMVHNGYFRKDLLFRLRTFTITIPPLREHPGDIKELVSYYLTKFSNHYGKGIKGFSPDFLDTLLEYDWPGNVRELINALERAIVASGESPTLFSRHLPSEIRIKVKRNHLGEDKKVTEVHQSAVSDLGSTFKTLQERREDAIVEAEKHYMMELMAHTKGNIKEACRISALSRSRLYALLKKYDISPRD